MALPLTRIAAALALTSSAAFGHGDGDFRLVPRRYPRAPSIRIEAPRFSVRFDACRPRHEHRWSRVCEREWLEPVFETRVVGYDCRRRPILERVLVREGCWIDVRYDVCRCGARIRR